MLKYKSVKGRNEGGAFEAEQSLCKALGPAETGLVCQCPAGESAEDPVRMPTAVNVMGTSSGTRCNMTWVLNSLWILHSEKVV